MLVTLASGQRLMMHRAASSLWNSPFVVETVTESGADQNDYYGSPTLSTGTSIMSGSWAWRSQEKRTGSEGGLFGKADLILVTDLINSGTLVGPSANFKAHLVVDGIRCTVVTVTTNPELGEIVVGAIRAQ